MSIYAWGPEWFYELCDRLSIEGQDLEDLWNEILDQSELIDDEKDRRSYLKLPLDKWLDE